MACDSFYRLRENAVVWSEQQDVTVALDISRGWYLGLNRAGTTLWHLLVVGASRTDLIDRLRDTFELDYERAARDVDAFLTTCLERNLLMAT